MNKANNAFYVLVTVAGLILIMCITIILVLFFETHVVINGITLKDFMTNFLVSITSVISAYLVYLGFGLQAKQMKISNADKSYDRCIKLIDDMVVLLNKVILTIQRTNSIIDVKAEDAIDAYVAYLVMDEQQRPKLLNKIDFDRNLFLYLSNVAFVYSNIEKLKIENKEYYDLLSSKMIFTIPTIYEHIHEMVKHESQIHIPDDEGKDGKYMYQTIQELYVHFEKMKKEDNMH